MVGSIWGRRGIEVSESIEGLAFVGNRLLLRIGQTGKLVITDQITMLALATLAVIAGIARKTITTPAIIPTAIAAVEVVVAHIGSLHCQTSIHWELLPCHFANQTLVVLI